MTYKDLTVNQKINLKELIISRKSRNEIGATSQRDHKFFDGLHALAIINKNFIESINIFLRDL